MNEEIINAFIIGIYFGAFVSALILYFIVIRTDRRLVRFQEEQLEYRHNFIMKLLNLLK